MDPRSVIQVPEAPKVGSILPCVVTQVLSWGSKVRSGDYWGTARGASGAVGDHIRVRVDEVQGNNFKGFRMS
jgi:hypothetical protein